MALTRKVQVGYASGLRTSGDKVSGDWPTESLAPSPAFVIYGCSYCYFIFGMIDIVISFFLQCLFFTGRKEKRSGACIR